MSNVAKAQTTPSTDTSKLSLSVSNAGKGENKMSEHNQSYSISFLYYSMTNFSLPKFNITFPNEKEQNGNLNSIPFREVYISL